MGVFRLLNHADLVEDEVGFYFANVETASESLFDVFSEGCCWLRHAVFEFAGGVFERVCFVDFDEEIAGKQCFEVWDYHRSTDQDDAGKDHGRDETESKGCVEGGFV